MADSQARMCAICQQHADGNVFAADCGHEFHAGCLSKWYRQCAQRAGSVQSPSVNCPLCRQPQRAYSVSVVLLGACTRILGTNDIRTTRCEIICLDSHSPVADIVDTLPARVTGNNNLLRLIHGGRVIQPADRLTFDDQRCSTLIIVDAENIPAGDFAHKLARIVANSRLAIFYRHDEQPHEVAVDLPTITVGGTPILAQSIRAFVPASRDQEGGYLLNFANPISFGQVVGIDDYPAVGLYYISAHGLISPVRPECGVLESLYPFDPRAMCDDRLPPLSLVALANRGQPASWPPARIGILRLIDVARDYDHHSTPSDRNRSCSM